MRKLTFIKFDGKTENALGTITLDGGKLNGSGFGIKILANRKDFSGSSDDAYLDDLINKFQPPYLYVKETN